MNQRTTLCLPIVILAVAIVYEWLTKGIPSRLIAGQAPESRFELVPVEYYDVPARAGGIDIIFVHGLGSNPDTTWRARRPTNTSSPTEEKPSNRDLDVNWVSDFLPSDLPLEIHKETRIFFYNYDSYWKRDAVFTRLPSVSNNLLQHIDTQIRISKGEQDRWLIFVASSYGGLVVKQALVQARQRREFNQIAEHTRAIFFLGTPHRGSSFGPWGRLAAFALQPLGSNPSILANLEYDSIVLNDLHEQFLATIRDDLQVVNVYEQRPLRLLRLWFFQWQVLCVPESSATYGGKTVGKIGLPVDHFGLNKFGSRNECYNSILSKLVAIVTPLLKPPKNHYAVPIGTVHTFTQRDLLWKEVEEKLQKRHEKASIPFAVTLHGLGGVGKSQLALKYAESNVDRYNPILWIDATSEETVRSSFARCAKELELPNENSNHQSTVLVDDQAIQNVLRWLRDRTEMDDEWLVIVDNADDISWGIKKVMPKGIRGKLIITSRDVLSRSLVDGGCEEVRIDVMSSQEARMVLLRHLSDGYMPGNIKAPPEAVLEDCDKVANELGYLALAIDLAGAYVGSSPDPEQALRRYLKDYEKHKDELLKMNDLRGLSPTERTVWTVWDTTLEKIEREYKQEEPGLLLTFLAHINSTIVQDEMFRLASSGISIVDQVLGEGNFDGIRSFVLEDDRGWDDFKYRRSVGILIRFSLIKPVHGEWAGTTMHRLVQWRAMRREKNQQWQLWYTKFVLAACSQLLQEDDQPQFRRHLMVHLPRVRDLVLSWTLNNKTSEVFIWRILAKIHTYEGQWKEAEQLYVQVLEALRPKLCDDHPEVLIAMHNLASIYNSEGRFEEAQQIHMQVAQTRKAKFGEDHPHTLTSIAALASTYWHQGRWKEAEQLQVQLMEILKIQLGNDHPDTLKIMSGLASTYSLQGQWEKAEQLHMQVIKARKTKLGHFHLATLDSMSNLASTYTSQGRWKEAEQLFEQVMEARKTILGDGHPDTLMSMSNLASTYSNQGRWNEAERLQVQVIDYYKTNLRETLGDDHPHTLTSMNNLASIYTHQGRWKEAEELFMEVIHFRKTKLGDDHPDTVRSMNDLALTYYNQGRWEDAEKLFVQVMEMRKLGDDHPDTLRSMNDLASTYYNQGRWEDAEKLFVQVMETSKAKLGEDHPDTLRSMSNLAFTWKFSGNAANAIDLLSICFSKQRDILGPNHPRTISTFENLRKWEADETGIIG